MPKLSPRVKIKTDTREYKLLSFLNEVESVILDAFFPKKYPEAALWRDFFGIDYKNDMDNNKINYFISKTLVRLKNKGLISKNGSTKKSIWKINNEGKKILYSLNRLSLPKKDGKTRLVIFDIPEIKKYCRQWIRDELIRHNFKMLQKSVWIGQRPLSEEVLRHDNMKKIIDNVHILEIKDLGTLENIDFED